MNESELYTIADSVKFLKISGSFFLWLVDHFNINRIEHRKITSNAVHEYFHIDDLEILLNELELNTEDLKINWKEWRSIEKEHETDEDDEYNSGFSDKVLAAYKIDFFTSVDVNFMNEDLYLVKSKECNECPTIEEQLNKQQTINKIKNNYGSNNSTNN